MKQSAAYQYCKWAVAESNHRVSIYVKKQCQQWMDIVDDKDADAYVDEQTYSKITKLLHLIIHSDLQKPMDEALEKYQWFIITALFCTKNREDDTRFYQTALLEIARKNFKTYTAAIIFILLMLTEPKFSRFFSVAPDLKLSKELQIAIRKIIKSSPVLSAEVNPVFKPLRNEIRCLLTESEYTPLAYSEDKMDGKLAHAFLGDECGAMDTYPVAAMRSSQITLPNKLGILISTQYPNDNNVLIDEIDKAKKTLDGLRRSRRYFALLYEPNPELQVGDIWQTDDRVIYQSNPVAVDNSILMDSILELRENAILYENERENYLCKHNNIKYKSLGVEGFIDIIKVRECRRVKDLDWWRGRNVWIGLDLSMSDDNVCVAMVTYEGNNLEESVIYVNTMGFIPLEAMASKSKREDVDYKRLVAESSCIACGDEIISYQIVEQYILDLPKTLGVNIMQVGYDRWNAISTVQKLEAEGIECVEIKQHSSILHTPTKLLKEKILTKRLQYDENLMLEINFQNARCTEDTNKNKYVNKKKSEGKVDQVVGVINALYLVEQDILNAEGNFVFQMV